MTDILERAKAADIDLMASTDWGQLRDLFGELIAEVEAKNDKIAQDAITIQMHHGNVLTLQKEVERLRSENKIISDRAAHHEKQDAAEIELLAARIKELEEANRNIDKRRDEMAAFIERLEAAFLDSLAARLYYEHYPGVSDAYSWHDYPEDACHCMPKEKFREKAREALERIKAETGSGDHVAGANKLILTAEQREALEHVIEYVQETQMPISNLNEFDMQELRSLLTGSKPAWEVTEERIEAIRRCMSMKADFYDLSVIETMLAEGKRDA